MDPTVDSVSAGGGLDLLASPYLWFGGELGLILLLVVLVVLRGAPAPTAAPRPATPSFFTLALTRTREAFTAQLDRLRGRRVDEAALEELEMALLSADVGVPTAQRVLDRLRTAAEDPAATLTTRLRAEMSAILLPLHSPIAALPAEGPLVILVVGVNGSGKTTTIGKLAARYRDAGKRVLLAAGDTFRAAAAEQLTVWAERAGAEIVSDAEGADPASVAYAALEAGVARGVDVVIIDTAGRLQTARPLMEQLSKMRRVIDKRVPGAPHETLLVLDGTIGQNALSQARLFHEATPLTGVVVTKLDGTAKGGVVFAVASELGLPIKLVGLGERVADLRDFDPAAFVDALIPPET